MRTFREKMRRVVAVGAVTALGAAGLGVVGLVGTSPAGADTTGYTVTCTGVPVLGTLSLPGTITTGSLASSVKSGVGISLTNYGIQLTIPGTLVSVATASGPSTVSGTVTEGVTATGLTPASQSTTINLPTTTLTSAEDSTGATIVGTGTGPAFTGGNSAGTASVSTVTGPVSVALTLGGTALPAFSCTNSAAEVIASTSVVLAPTATASPSSTVFTSTGSSTAISVSGANWPASESGALKFTTGTDVGTFTTNASGVLTGSINATEAGEQGANSATFSDPIIASDASGNSATAAFNITPFQTLPTTCTATAAGNGVGGTVPPPGGAVFCGIKQQISAQVIGTNLSISETSNQVTLSSVTLGTGSGTSEQQFGGAVGALNTVTVSDDRGTLSGWSVSVQMEGDFTNTSPVGPTVDNVIPADFLSIAPKVSLETAGSLPGNNANTPFCPTGTTYDVFAALHGTSQCVGPSGLPVPLSGTSQGTAGAKGVNGTALGTGGVSTTPSEVVAGPNAAVNNSAGSASTLCTTTGGSASGKGGGGGFNCDAAMALAIPPYVAAGNYQATMDIVVVGF